jgi:tripartite-type tricarboxylate transporter receptor subunit TctC
MKPAFRVFAVVALLVCAWGSAVAQQYPARIITLNSAMAAGATTDVLAREIAKLLSERLGQQIIVEANAGGGGLVATQKVINAAPDGYSLLFVTNSLIANQAMRSKPEFDLSRDLVAISPVLEGTFGMYINPEVPANTVQEFIAYAKGRPGKINYGSSGVGSIVHLITEDFKIRAGLNMVHVPYKGGAEYLPATISNQVQASFLDVTFAQPQADAGKVRLLAVTSKQRLPNLPNVPTFEESGMNGYSPTFWIGMYAPRGTPQPVIDKLNGELRAILTPVEARARYAARGYQTMWAPPADAQRMVIEELNNLNKTIDTVKIQRQ